MASYNPEGRTLYTYTAIQAFALAAARAKSVKLDDLSKALHSMTVQSVRRGTRRAISSARNSSSTIAQRHLFAEM